MSGGIPSGPLTLAARVKDFTPSVLDRVIAEEGSVLPIPTARLRVRRHPGVSPNPAAGADGKGRVQRNGSICLYRKSNIDSQPTIIVR